MRWTKPVAAFAALMAAASLAPREEGASLAIARGQALGAICGESSTLAGSTLQQLLQGASAYAQTLPANETPPPLLPGLGDAHFNITTTSPAAQAYFDQGVRFMYAFNHLEALRAFRYAQTLDPSCAMCFWGEAYALGPNLNAAMRADDAPVAVNAAQTALRLAANVTPVERGLIEAVQTRYTAPAPERRGPLDTAFADAMRDLADRFPADDIVQVTAAESVMVRQRWDYWEDDGITPKYRAAEAIARVETVLARSPSDAGAIHFYIHLMEGSRDPWRAEAAADRLTAAGLQTGHLVHMPGHIYFRVGRFRDSVRANIAAAAVDAQYVAAGGASPIYRYGYYPHNLHFVTTSAAMGGDGRTALDYANRLDAALPYEAASTGFLSQHVKGAPWFVRARFETPQQVLAREAPPENFAYITGAWRYARAMAHVRQGNPQGGRTELAALVTLIEAQPQGDRRSYMDIYRRAMESRVLMAEGDLPAAIALLREASAAQTTVTYTEPPNIYYPIRRTLGAAYLRNNQPALAEREFLQVLIESPNDAFAYWGLAEAKRRRGDRVGAAAAMRLHRAAYLGRARVTLADL